MAKVWKATTRAQYWDKLEVISPAVMGGGAFMLGEPQRHNADGQPMFWGFKEVGGKFFETVEPMTIPEFAKLCPGVEPYVYNMNGERG